MVDPGSTFAPILPRTLDAGAGFDQLYDALPGRGIRARGLVGTAAAGGEILRARHHQLLGREAREHFVAGLGHDDFFLDSRRAPSTVFRRPERFEREHQAGLSFRRNVRAKPKRLITRLLPDREPDSVAELQRERRPLHPGNPNSCALGQTAATSAVRSARPDQFNRGVQIVAAAAIGIIESVRPVADGERSVVTRSVPHVGMENVEINGIARAAARGPKIHADAGCSARRKWRSRLPRIPSQVVEHLAGDPDGLNFR